MVISVLPFSASADPITWGVLGGMALGALVSWGVDLVMNAVADAVYPPSVPSWVHDVVLRGSDGTVYTVEDYTSVYPGGTTLTDSGFSHSSGSFAPEAYKLRSPDGKTWYLYQDDVNAAYNTYVSNMPSQVVYYGSQIDLPFHLHDDSVTAFNNSVSKGQISNFTHGENFMDFAIRSYTSANAYGGNTYYWSYPQASFVTAPFQVPAGEYRVASFTANGYDYTIGTLALERLVDGAWQSVGLINTNYSVTTTSLYKLRAYDIIPKTFDLLSGVTYRFRFGSSCESRTSTGEATYVDFPRRIDCSCVSVVPVESVPASVPTSALDRPTAPIQYAYYTNNNTYNYAPASTNIIYEGDNYYYNPVTNNTYDLSTWTYDYSSRTYYATTTEDNSVSVTYGDEYVTIVEGDTVYNLYYVIQVPDEPTAAPCTHDYVLTSTVEPTCEIPGYSLYTCSLCGRSYDVPISPLGHDWEWVETVANEPGTNDAAGEPEPPPAVVEPEPETEDPAGDQPGAGEGTIAEGPIIITQQPVDAYGELGDYFFFSVHAIGDGLTFVWQVSSNGSTWGSTSAVATSNETYSQLRCRPSKLGSFYRCKIVDANNNVVYSAPCRVCPFDSLEILHQPEALQCHVGSCAVFSVEVSGSFPSFVWEYRSSNDDVWTSADYPGFDTVELTVPVSADLDGASFRCVVTNSKGETLISDEAVLSVLPSETPDSSADDGDPQPQLFDLYRCRRCGETRLVREGDSPVSFYSGSGLSSSWLNEFRSSLYERLDAILDEAKRDYNEKLDEILGALQSGSSFLDTLFNGVTALSSLFDIPSLDDLLGVGGDILDGVTDSLPDIDFDLTDVQGAGASGSIAGILAAFAWWRTVWDIGKMFVETVSANEQAAYAYDADAPGSNPPGAPSIPLDLSAAHSFYGYDYGGQVEMFDLSWYTPYKETVDHIISGFLWLSFLWALFRHAPGIISGAGLTHSRMDDLTDGKRGKK